MAIDKQKTSWSALWSAVENGSLSLLSFLSLIIFARLLTPQDFGVFATALALIELIQILPNMTFHDALVQRPDVTERHYDTAFVSSLILSAVLVAGCFLVGPYFSQASHSALAGPVLGWLSVGMFLNTTASTLIARQRREFGFKTLALRSMVGRICGSVAGIVAAALGCGIWSLVVQQIAMAGLSSAILWLTSRQRPGLNFGRTEFGQLVRFGVAAVSSLFVNFATKRVFVTCCGLFLGPAVAGLLNLAFRLIDTFWAVSATALSQVALPMLSALQTDFDRLKSAYGRAVSLTAVTLYALFIGIGAVAPEVIELLFGPKWASSAPYVTVLSFLVLLQAPRLFSTPFLTAIGRPHKVFYAYLAGLAYMAVAIALTRLANIQIAVAVWVGCELVYTPVFALMLKRAVGLTVFQQYSRVIGPALSAAVMVGVIWAERFLLPGGLNIYLRLLVFIPSGAAAYAATLFLCDRAVIGELQGFVMVFLKRPAKPVVEG